MTQKPGEPASKFLARAQNLRTQITFAGGVITESELVSKVMVGIDSKYLPAVLNAKRHQILTMSVLLSYLSEMEASVKGATGFNAEANFAGASGGFKGKCFNCGEVGHREAHWMRAAYVGNVTTHR